ncbi:TonB-dependent receptor plug domain-containing protein [Massilia yuzhufengensis]|uniref:Iron complex outermembrane recepter protein n=1 Tax=Massilia yuzhufengensis TaxID=1164594 RepID=A0A1I1PVA3_9BURK|nr:TonB-dependent receptor [Massilia yuzhufengensis]SFD09840.1 iron complex outermembrane recepter protein [Massilia yuzhufengensis]
MQDDVQGGSAGEPQLADYSLEQLSDIVVTSVSRQQGRLSSAPASLYVISGAEIARSGATTVPEALRLAPNLQVAFTGAQEYAVSARGFSSPLANKLLVLVDGRSVYSPLYSGVFWEAQDVVMADIERIEVISGPGGTIWGTNAVNGVINIITRSAADTQGGLAVVHAGNRYAGATVRYGKRLANGAFVRVYGKRDEAGAAADDSGGHGGGVGRRQAGFRLDWEGAGRTLSVHGDMHAGALRASSEARTSFSGANLGARFDADLAGDAQLRLQVYVDQGEREQRGAGRYQLDTFDVEAQYGWRVGERHALTWGGGYRHARDRFDNGPVLQFVPAQRRLRWANLFAQDEISLAPALRATAGLRLEHNDYTGTEVLPSLRLAWDTAPGAMLWAAASRTVRAPARIDRDMLLLNPVYGTGEGGMRYLVAGGPDMQSETARVLELGYRAQPTTALSYAATLFYSDYARLRTLELQAGGAVFRNLGHGRARGLELWGSLQAARGWRLSAGAVWQDIGTGAAASSTDASARTGQATNDPRSYWTLRSSHDLGPGLVADLLLRRVAHLPQPAVPGYHELDARIAWQARPGVELALAGRNLLHARHPEFGAAGLRQLAERSVFASASLRF